LGLMSVLPWSYIMIHSICNCIWLSCLVYMGCSVDATLSCTIAGCEFIWGLSVFFPHRVISSHLFYIFRLLKTRSVMRYSLICFDRFDSFVWPGLCTTWIHRKVLHSFWFSIQFFIVCISRIYFARIYSLLN